MTREQELIKGLLNGDAERYVSFIEGTNNAPTDISKFRQLEAVCLPIIDQLEKIKANCELLEKDKEEVSQNMLIFQDLTKDFDELKSHHEKAKTQLTEKESLLQDALQKLAFINPNKAFLAKAGNWITGITLSALIANLKHLVPGYLKLMPEHIKTGNNWIDIGICIFVFLCLDASIILMIKTGQKKWAAAYTIGTIALTLIGVIFANFAYSQEAFFIVSSLMFSGIIYCFASLQSESS